MREIIREVLAREHADSFFLTDHVPSGWLVAVQQMLPHPPYIHRGRIAVFVQLLNDHLPLALNFFRLQKRVFINIGE